MTDSKREYATIVIGNRNQTHLVPLPPDLKRYIRIDVLLEGSNIAGCNALTGDSLDEVDMAAFLKAKAALHEPTPSPSGVEHAIDKLTGLVNESMRVARDAEKSSMDCVFDYATMNARVSQLESLHKISPDDSAEPITEEWLLSVGFRLVYKNDPTFAVENFHITRFTGKWQRLDEHWNRDDGLLIETRRDVRILCELLRIELKESK